eukprot:scaffold2872_cov193-Amphora_coffeaeformis.AAC.3
MPNLDIAIEFEQQQQQQQQQPVCAGQHLRGKVTLDAKQEIPAKELLLTLNGEEVTRVEYSEWHEENGVRNERTKTDTGYRAFLTAQIPVETFSVIQQGKVFPGKYQVPFDVELPEHIPSSFIVENGISNHCKIQYELKVQLRGSGNLWDYKQTKSVPIKGKSLPRDPLPFFSQPVEQAAKFCCFNQGNILFGAKVLDTRLDMGETCQIHLSIRNNSTVEIKEVGAKLSQVVFWEGRQAHPSTKSRELGSFTFPKLPGTQAQGDGERDIEVGQLQVVFKEIEEGHHAAEITMPTDALASYNGSFIKVTHHLQIYVNAGKCVSSPELDVPILCGETPSPDAAAATTQDTSAIPSAVVVPSSSVNIGGLPTQSDDPDLVFASPSESTPSIDTLLTEMKASVADLQLVEAKLKDPAWNFVFQGIKPNDMTKIVQQIDMDFDQPRIAGKIADKMENFTCEHALAAMKATKEWNRSNMVEVLLSKCSDVSTKANIIKDELSDWERVVTQSTFDKVGLSNVSK